MAANSPGASSSEQALGPSSRWPRTRSSVERLATGVFVALVIGSFAAFFVIQRLKHESKPIPQFYVEPSFDPAHTGKSRVEAISFQLERAGVVTVEIVGANERAVRTLVADESVAAERTVTLRWNGLTDSGAPAGAGTYEVIVKLLSQGLEVRLPKSFALERPAQPGR